MEKELRQYTGYVYRIYESDPEYPMYKTPIIAYNKEQALEAFKNKYHKELLKKEKYILKFEDPYMDTLDIL